MNKIVFQNVLKVFSGVFTLVLAIALIGATYTLGFYQGINYGQEKSDNFYAQQVSSILNAFTNIEVTPTPVEITNNFKEETKEITYIRNSNWGGPDLWDAVNKRRQEMGVNPLNQKDELCTIASIRLNELLELGKLDGHEGFSNMTEKRPDLQSIFSNYSTVAEFLAAGGESPQETVSMWENSLGHKKLLTGGEYVWGCIYAQNSFAVAITAF
ncbi:hypothetical protein IPM62_05915 [Candidatus Woesebacteria bacterium]|nr:MAG: hypothetical protein IPM62_05915 [Candidatus Woesebacteria bacterium]